MNELTTPANSAVSIIQGIEIRPCEGFPNYSVTRDGRVWSNRRGRWRKPHVNCKRGYLQIGLKHSSSTVYIHRLVAEAYIGKIDGFHVDHINRNRQDNRVENLRWVSVSANASNCASKGAGSGFRGVHKLWNGTWSVRFTRDGNKHHIGTFRCATKAAEAYDEAIRKIDGEHAITNF